MAPWTRRDVKTLRENPNDLPFDDLQVSLSSAKRPSSNEPDWITNYDWGIGSGITFPVLGFAIDEYIDFYVQTSHSMKLNTVLDNHVHGTLPSNDAGKKVKWQLDVIAAGIGSSWAVVDGSPFTREFTLKGTEAHRHNMLDLADIPAVNTTVSTIYICRLTRINATSDDYGSDVYLVFNDCHYKKDSSGSYAEGYKLEGKYINMKGEPKESYRPGAF